MPSTTVQLRSTAFMIAAAGLMTLTAATVAALTVPASGSLYQPIQAISSDLGSKRAIGYFTQHGQACRLTLMIAEAIDPAAAPVQSAARVRFSLAEGQNAELDSEEGRFVELTCGAGGRTLSVVEGLRAGERALTQ